MNNTQLLPSEHNQRFLQMLEIGRLLVSTLDIDKVMTLIMEKIRSIFHAETSSLLLIDPETQELVFQVALGDAGAIVKQFRLKPGEGLAGYVVRTGSPIFSNNVRQDSRHYTGVDVTTKFQTDTMMVVPLNIRDEIIGVIEVINSITGEFSTIDFELLKILAPFAAIAIDNARYSQNLERIVTERTSELSESNRRLREIDTAKSEFLSTAAHELRTPLGAMKTFLSLLVSERLGKINELQTEALTDCQDSIERLLRMIESLLSLAKIEAGIIELKIQKVSAIDKMHDVVRLLEPKASEKSIILRSHCEDGFVRCDPDKLEQIWLNFVGNAIKFTPTQGIVTLDGRIEGDLWRFDIEDTGPGMTEEQAHSLFVRFQRLTDVSSEKISGTGLGLAISKKLAEQQGGHVAVESTPGRGSIFSFFLPVWLEQEER